MTIKYHSKGYLMKTLLLTTAFVFTLVAGAFAQDGFRELVRNTVEEKGDAVITIEVVTQQKYSYGGSQQESEVKSEAIGTVIDPSGLVITALSNIDQAQLYRRLQSEEQDTGYTSTVKDIKFILADNSEIRATVVLRDPDLDLAFLRPQKPLEEEMTAVDLSDAATPEIASQAFVVGRMGRIARRISLGMTGEIQGIVTRPRRYYIPSAELVSSGSGTPIFNEEGKIIGIVLLHIFPGGRSAATSVDEMLINVVRPAKDIANIAQQVPDEAPEQDDELVGSDDEEVEMESKNVSDDEEEGTE